MFRMIVVRNETVLQCSIKRITKGNLNTVRGVAYTCANKLIQPQRWVNVFSIKLNLIETEVDSLIKIVFIYICMICVWKRGYVRLYNQNVYSQIVFVLYMRATS